MGKTNPQKLQNYQKVLYRGLARLADGGGGTQKFQTRESHLYNMLSKGMDKNFILSKEKPLTPNID